MYISQSNLNRVINRVKGENLYLGDLYNADIQFCLSNAETGFLGKAKTFFLSADRLSLMFDPIEITDNLSFIFASQTPAYHLSNQCQRLNSNWFNYYVPIEVRNRGVQEVLRFRKFISESIKRDNLYLGHPALTIALKAEFKILDTNFGRVEKNNSGVVAFGDELEKANLEYITYALDTIYKELSVFKDQSNIHKKIYDMRYFDPNKIKRLTKFSSPEEKEIAEQFAELKAKLIIALVESYKKENDFDQNMVEEDLLIQLGFHKCSACRDNH